MQEVINGITNMKRSIIKSAGGLYYVLDEPTIPHHLNTTLIACIGGSGEYTTTFDDASILRVANRNGFAQDVANGQEFPFVVISPIAGKSKDENMADHGLIMREISNVAKVHKKDYAFIGGLSLGSQTATGLLLQCRNGTEVLKGLESQYKNPYIWDGGFLISGKIPGTPQPCAMPDIPIIIFGNTGDLAVPIQNQIKTMDSFNSCSLRTNRILPNRVRKSIGGVVTWPEVPIPDGHLNRLIITLGGGHGTSWVMMYDWNASSGPGYEFRKWVERIAVQKYVPIQCTAVLNERELWADFSLPDGTVKRYEILPNQ
jgi:hypothetical protein